MAPIRKTVKMRAIERKHRRELEDIRRHLMANGRRSWHVKRIRRETLVALKMLYPAPLQAEQLFRSLLCVFPTLEWDAFRRDLTYLCEKGYLQRVVADTERDERLTPWRKRWFRLTTSGLEVTDQVVSDPALDLEP